MRIHHIQRAISTVTATSTATGFAADNITRREIRRAWRSTSGSGQTVTIDLGSEQTVEALWLQAVNFESATISYSTDGTNYTSVGTMACALEHNERRKGLITVAATARYLRVVIGAGSPTEGYWSIGTVYVFGAVYQSPKAPNYDLAYETITPGVGRVLPNGRPVTARTGPLFTRISGEFRHRPTEDVAALIRLARSSGTIGLDLEIAETPWKAWPVEYVAQSYEAKMPSVGYDETAFDLVEVV